MANRPPLIRRTVNTHTHTMALPAPWERKLVVSKWLQYRSPSQLALAEAKVNEILARPQQTEGQKITLIRERFAYYDRLDVTTMLELDMEGKHCWQ